MRSIIGSALGVLLLAALPAALAAEDAPPRETPGMESPAERTRRHQLRREKMRRRIEVIRIARVTEELDLDAETAVRLVPVLADFDELDREHRQARKRIGGELKDLIESDGPDEAALEATVAQWWDNEEAHVQRRREIFDKLDALLSTEQRVRLLLFVPRFQREVRSLARDMARGGRHGEHAGRRGGRRGWFGHGSDAMDEGGPPDRPWHHREPEAP